MESFTLPAATYEAPSRQVRLKLNTIIEDEYSIEGEDAEEQRGRSRSPSSRSNPPDSPVPSSASTISSYYRKSRLSRDFDDLYDVSESESDQDSIEVPTISVKRASGDSECSLKRNSWNGHRRNRYPSLQIPSPRLWPTIEKFRKELAVPPTPPAKIPLSPAVLSKLNTNASLSSAPPSLDGSLTSDQIASSSAPPTPSEFDHPEHVKKWSQLQVAGSESDSAMGDADVVIEIPEEGIQRNSGVRLPEGALDVLQHLSLDLNFEPPSAVPSDAQEEMQEVPFKLQRSPSMEFEPKSAASEYSVAQLSIPSPGGFFSSLDEDAQHAWFTLNVTPPVNNDVPPSSTTAEHFYDAPWNTRKNAIAEQTVTVSESNTEGPQTALFVPFSPTNAADRESSHPAVSSTSERSDATEIKGIEILDILDKELKISTATILDRTTDWLAAQNSYMAALGETNPANRLRESDPTSKHSSATDSLDSGLKRAVKFLETDTAKAAEQSDEVSSPTKSDPLFYHAFQHMSNSSSPTDSFIHRHSRFDAIQAQRTSFQISHVDALLGRYETSATNRPNPLRPISMMPGKSKDEEGTPEQRLISRVERERQALEQVAPAMWVVEALRFLSGGRLFNSPVATVLRRAQPLETATLPDHVRVLDLGGQPQCDWAWHCARDFPNVKTYTATSSTELNDSIRGPSNHRLCPVDNLWTLPFPANHFDAVSARSLPTFLRTIKPLGNSTDEFDLCLRECMRVLKPGGYLEFFVLDAEIVHGALDSHAPAGPLADAASVEFGFKLRQQGYDPVPSKSFLARVRRTGYIDIKRAWCFLPMGATAGENLPPMPETPPPRASLYEDEIASRQVEAVQGPVGSKADAACISGLVGGWLWEQWLLKLQLEMGKTKGVKLIDGVAAVVEEGKRTGAGWRVLRGWARKGM